MSKPHVNPEEQKFIALLQEENPEISEQLCREFYLALEAVQALHAIPKGQPIRIRRDMK